MAQKSNRKRISRGKRHKFSEYFFFIHTGFFLSHFKALEHFIKYSNFQNACDFSVSKLTLLATEKNVTFQFDSMLIWNVRTIERFKLNCLDAIQCTHLVSVSGIALERHTYRAMSLNACYNWANMIVNVNMDSSWIECAIAKMIQRNWATRWGGWSMLISVLF